MKDLDRRGSSCTCLNSDSIFLIVQLQLPHSYHFVTETFATSETIIKQKFLLLCIINALHSH